MIAKDFLLIERISTDFLKIIPKKYTDFSEYLSMVLSIVDNEKVEISNGEFLLQDKNQLNVTSKKEKASFPRKSTGKKSTLLVPISPRSLKHKLKRIALK